MQEQRQSRLQYQAFVHYGLRSVPRIIILHRLDCYHLGLPKAAGRFLQGAGRLHYEG